MDRPKKCLDAMGIDTDPKLFLSRQRKILSEISQSSQAKQELLRHAALGHDLRYKLYRLLQQNEYCLTILAHMTGKSKSTISHHLAILERASLVIGRKRGLFTFYSSVEFFYEKRVRPTMSSLA